MSGPSRATVESQPDCEFGRVLSRTLLPPLPCPPTSQYAHAGGKRRASRSGATPPCGAQKTSFPSFPLFSFIFRLSFFSFFFHSARPAGLCTSLHYYYGCCQSFCAYKLVAACLKLPNFDSSPFLSLSDSPSLSVSSSSSVSPPLSPSVSRPPVRREAADEGCGQRWGGRAWRMGGADGGGGGFELGWSKFEFW